MVMHYHESECHGKRFVCYFRDEGHNVGSYNEDMTISTMFLSSRDEEVSSENQKSFLLSY